jgi:hypothetical protein
LAGIVPYDGIKIKGFCFDKLSTPETKLFSSNFTGKLLMFVTSNIYSATSPTITF